MGSLQTTLVQVVLRRINYVGDRRRTSLHRRPATVAESGRCEHLVMIVEKRDYVLPCVARHGCFADDGRAKHAGRLSALEGSQAVFVSLETAGGPRLPTCDVCGPVHTVRGAVGRGDLGVQFGAPLLRRAGPASRLAHHL
jgi:hypothetical protein